MKRRPNLVLRDPVKLYEPNVDVKLNPLSNEIKDISEQTGQETLLEATEKNLIDIKNEGEVRMSERELIESVRDKMSPRIQQIWDYFSRKAKADGELTKSFTLTRAEVMKEAGIGSTNTYRDALKKFRELNLLEIELRPGVNSGSVFILTEKGIEQL